MLQEEKDASISPEKEEVAEEEESGGESSAEPEAEPEDEAAKFVAAGEGVTSHKGETKKVFFLQQRKGSENASSGQWLKSVTSAAGTAMTNATAAAGTAMTAAGDTMQRLTKKSDEKKETESMESEDKPKKERLKQLVDASRASVETASTRLSGLMASMKPERDSITSTESATEDTAKETPEQPTTSRLAALRSAMATLGAWKERQDDVADLKQQISDLKDLVASLSDRIVTLEKVNNIEPPPAPAAQAQEESTPDGDPDA